MLPVALSHHHGSADRRLASLPAKKSKGPLPARSSVRFVLLAAVFYLFHYNWSFTYQIRLLVAYPSINDNRDFEPPESETDRNLANEGTSGDDSIVAGQADDSLLTIDLFGLRINRDSDSAFLEVMETRQHEGWQGPPMWITSYLAWHRETREAYEDLQNPDNLPPLLVNHCPGSGCGGLHDRLGSLPFDLYMANQTNRLLVYVWEQPALEEFLVPPIFGDGGVDWTFPHKHLIQNASDIMRLGTKDYKWEGHAASTKFWEKYVPNAIAAASEGDNIITLKARGHAGEWYMEDIFRNLGETDLIHTTPTFGWLWRAFFQPSPGLYAYLERVQSAMNLTKPYGAVHCRVHYPDLIRQNFNARARRFRLKTVDEPTSKLDAARKNPDVNGLKMEGLGKKFAVKVGLHALQCAAQVMKRRNEQIVQNEDREEEAPPLYLFADNNGMVDYLTHNVSALLSPNTDSETPAIVLDRTDTTAMKIMKNLKNRVVARPDISNRNYHIDMADPEVRKTLDPSVFYATFADLYLAIRAKCISFGYGGFGRFAQQLNNNPCYVQHQLHIMEFYKGHAMHMTENVCADANVTAMRAK